MSPIQTLTALFKRERKLLCHHQQRGSLCYRDQVSEYGHQGEKPNLGVNRGNVQLRGSGIANDGKIRTVRYSRAVYCEIVEQVDGISGKFLGHQSSVWTFRVEEEITSYSWFCVMEHLSQMRCVELWQFLLEMNTVIPRIKLDSQWYRKINATVLRNSGALIRTNTVYLINLSENNSFFFVCCTFKIRIFIRMFI